MNWNILLDLYEKNKSQVGNIDYRRIGKKDEDVVPYVLLPPFHTTVAAQVNVVIDENGNFLRAEPVLNTEKLTIIPVTEKSGSRTAGKEPHPLCDNLKYIAGDYCRFVKDEKGGLDICYLLYIKALEQWHLSEHTHKKVDAVYAYLNRKKVMDDLIRERVLEVNEDGCLTNKKIQNIPQENVFVRFTVQSASPDVTDECWRDPTLWDSFIEYSRSLEKEQELDYLTGKKEAPSYLHSRKIRNEGDGAKLISSNDEANFTFRGRFLTKEQAQAIGIEASQKIHNALKWIIRKQGYDYDTMVIVAWESNMLKMPLWSSSTEQIVSAYAQEQAESENEDNLFEDIALDIEPETPEEEITDTNVVTASDFISALQGYRRRLYHTSKMVLLAVDAATPGRLALVECKTLDSSRYLKNIELWHSQCEWLHTKRSHKKIKSYYGMTGVRETIEILYGSEGAGDLLTMSDASRKKLYKNMGQMLLSCIWDRSKIPYCFVTAAVNRASSPQSYKDRYNWERVLSLACSLVKKYRYDYVDKKEEWKVALDENCRIRSYLYGRLLAVADRMEYRTYDKDKDSGRITNAKRYMTTFSQRPFETWKIIEENLGPYRGKLGIKERHYYDNLIDKISALFDVEAFSDNTKLDGLYLLGFHSQSFDMKKMKTEISAQGAEEEESNE